MRICRPPLLILLACACLSAVSASPKVEFFSAAATSAATPRSANLNPAAFYSSVLGSWTGSLEYRDFQNDKRVTLPTTLEVSPTTDQSAVQFAYTYDDGPGKIVKEKALIRVPATGDQYIVKDDDGSETVYQITTAAGFSASGDGKLVLSGPGTENKKAVEVRTTLEITSISLSILRETRLPGEDFKFRHQYKFQRSLASADKP